MSAAAPVRARSFNCPNCGGNVQLRGFAHSLSAVCVQCCTIIDPSTPELKILQKFDEKMRVQPLIPLGTRGRFDNAPHEVIGFQVRTITVDGTDYSWHEYLLFNPYRGFRYLSQYDGHWNEITMVRGLPKDLGTPHSSVSYGGHTYKHFQTARARTAFVMGEFPWRVRVDEEVVVADYTCAPFLLSLERTENETTWSAGVYRTGTEIWQACGLKSSPPPARGVFVNQPSPYRGKVAAIWTKALLFVALWIVLLAWFSLSPAKSQAFKQTFNFKAANTGEASFVTDYFELKGGTKNVELELETDLYNDWAFFNIALINSDSGQAFDVGREVSYYAGSDSDGSWTEGNRKDSVIIAGVPGGKYYLRIEPDMDDDNPALGTLNRLRQVIYTVVVKRDVPVLWPLWLAFPLLFIPPIVVAIQAGSFEGRRWAESDHAPSTANDSSDEDDD